jgi:protein-tyrosine kinase
VIVSRIQEALRRATDAPDGASVRSSPEPFVSAWSVDQPAPEALEELSRPGFVESGNLLQQESHPDLLSLSSKWSERLATGPTRDGVLVEQFRRLAATLHHAQASSGIRTILVTSAAAADGKTLTAINLALVLSESYGRRVLLIDADLRRPSIGNVGDVTGCTGLSEALKAPVDQKVTVLQIAPRLTLLPAGQPDPNPLAGLSSPRMRQILEDAAAQFDWVIIDAPPVGPVADANLLAEMTDGALFVVRAGGTRSAMVEKAVETLGRSRILGVVLNGVDRLPTHAYDGYYGDQPLTK